MSNYHLMSSKIYFVPSIFLITTCSVSGQTVAPGWTYPQILRSTLDTFYMDNKTWDAPQALAIDRTSNPNWGTYGSEGTFMDVYTELDTFRIFHLNYPEAQEVRILVSNSRDSVEAIVRFQASNAEFDSTYRQDHAGHVDFSIPEAYELANVALFLSSCGEVTGNSPKTTYGEEVNQYFGAYLSHPLIQTLTAACRTGEESAFQPYYSYRENSIAYTFNDLNILNRGTPYKLVFWDGTDASSGKFGDLVLLTQDFAQRSNFRKFFTSHSKYYDKIIVTQKEIVDVVRMRTWLESEFSARINSYRIISSPLIGASHSTSRFFYGELFSPSFQEAIFFINTPPSERASSQKMREREVDYSGILFTEIDHNYVNPVSYKYSDEIQQHFSDKSEWYEYPDSGMYSNAVAIFNEYMTHAIFCVYAKEQMSQDRYELAVQDRSALMRRRGFIRFDAFSAFLQDICKKRAEGETIEALYPVILAGLEQL